MTIIIVSIAIFLIGFLVLLYALCRVSGMCSRAEEQRDLLRRMEEASKPKIVNGHDV
jgi:hypothetical protein